jgi:hypothetical protein
MVLLKNIFPAGVTAHGPERQQRQEQQAQRHHFERVRVRLERGEKVHAEGGCDEAADGEGDGGHGQLDVELKHPDGGSSDDGGGGRDGGGGGGGGGGALTCYVLCRGSR